jgi:hypothetical protein
MQITPPFGYGAIAPLEKHHRVLLPSTAEGAVPAFAARINAMAISFAEFALAQRDYPIVFLSGDAGATFAPVAVLGLADGENLFVTAAGRWEAGHYVPAFVRRFPFCASTVTLDGVLQEKRLVCVDRAYLDAGGIALYDAAGAPTPAWAERERLLIEYESDLERTAQMCAYLKKLDLFVPMTMEIKHAGQTGLRMQGMYCVDEARLAALNAAAHKALATRGMAARVYAHLFSLAGFARLVERANARAAARPGDTPQSRRK